MVTLSALLWPDFGRLAGFWPDISAMCQVEIARFRIFASFLGRWKMCWKFSPDFQQMIFASKNWPDLTEMIFSEKKITRFSPDYLAVRNLEKKKFHHREKLARFNRDEFF